MKPGKYVGVKLSPDQAHAQRLVRRAFARRVALADTLMCSPDFHTRAYWHERLDWYLNEIDRMNGAAVKLFPDVQESLVVASMEVKL